MHRLKISIRSSLPTFWQAPTGFRVPTFQMLRDGEDRIPAVAGALPYNVPAPPLVGGADCGEPSELLPGQILPWAHNFLQASAGFGVPTFQFAIFQGLKEPLRCNT